MPEHTKTPWIRYPRDLFNHTNKDGFAIATQDEEKQIAALPIYEGNTREETEANARFIITACNSHDKLIEALKNIIERHDEGLALGEKLDLAPARQALKLGATPESRSE